MVDMIHSRHSVGGSGPRRRDAAPASLMDPHKMCTDRDRTGGANCEGVEVLLDAGNAIDGCVDGADAVLCSGRASE